MIVPRTTTAVADVARHYNDLDTFYRELWGEHMHHGLWRGRVRPVKDAVLALIDLVAAAAQIGPGARVCDVGAGYGATSRVLAHRYHATVTALTVSDAQYAYARAAGPAGNPTYLLRDWLHNELPDASFDAAIALESTEHMQDKAGAFREMCRVIRPGGRVVICAWIAAETPSQWQIDHLLEPICREGRLAGMGSTSEYTALLRGAGLVVDTTEDLSAGVHWTWPICIARTAVGLLRHQHYREFVRDQTQANRVFLLTLPRLWAAYLTGAMRYVLFAAHRPD